MKLKIIFYLTIVMLSANSYAQNSKLKIYVDEKMELITTVQYLSDYEVLTQADIEYKNEIKVYFEKYKDHPIIQINKIVQNDYFNFSAVPWYLYQFSFPDFKPISTFTKEENQIVNFETHKNTLELYKKELKDFYEKSNFHKFFVDHKIFYDSVTKSVKDYIYPYKIDKLLENQYGIKKKQYNLVLSPLMHDGGFAVGVKTKNGEAIFAFIGPKGVSKSYPFFNAKTILQEYVLHEFSHSFCNPVIIKYYKELEKDSCLLKPIADQMAKQNYTNWEFVLYEHLVRANEVVLTERILGKIASDNVYSEYYDKRNWIYLKGLVPLIRNEYLKNRGKYKTQYDLKDKLSAYFNLENEINCH